MKTKSPSKIVLSLVVVDPYGTHHLSLEDVAVQAHLLDLEGKNLYVYESRELERQVKPYHLSAWREYLEQYHQAVRFLVEQDMAKTGRTEIEHWLS